MAAGSSKTSLTGACFLGLAVAAAFFFVVDALTVVAFLTLLTAALITFGSMIG